MKDRRAILLIVVIALLAVLAGFYLFGAGEDGETHGWAYTAGAILLLLLLVGAASGGSRGKRVVRDEEERKDG